MSRPDKLYDGQCANLAEHFLADETDVTPQDREELAREIQQAIEDWLDAREADRR